MKDRPRPPALTAGAGPSLLTDQQLRRCPAALYEAGGVCFRDPRLCRSEHCKAPSIFRYRSVAHPVPATADFHTVLARSLLAHRGHVVLFLVVYPPTTVAPNLLAASGTHGSSRTRRFPCPPNAEKSRLRHELDKWKRFQIRFRKVIREDPPKQCLLCPYGGM